MLQRTWMLSLVLAAFGYTLHVKDVFQPPKPAIAETWTSDPSLHRENVDFTAGKATIRGWLYSSDRADAPYVLFFYGSNEDLAHEAIRLAWLRDTFHVNAVCFDYPGYGYSSGAIDATALRAAALQEFDFVQARNAQSKAAVVVYGWSIGTAPAIHVAAERKVAGVILQAPPASAEEMVRWSSRHDVPWYAHGVVKIKADPDIARFYEGAAAIATVASPLLVLQGELDDVVPIEQGREVFRASPSLQKEFVEVPGAHHNDLRVSKAPASDAIGRFLESVQH